MPSKKKKYNARFPAGRIKKIMRTDEEVGKVAQAVPVIISRALELFVQSLLTRSTEVTKRRNAKTLSPSHLKQCILNETRFDFLRDLVKNIPDVSAAEEREAQSGENSPTSSACSEPCAPSPAPTQRTFPELKRRNSDTHTHTVTPPPKFARSETVSSPSQPMDLTKPDLRRPNFYQETLKDEEPQSVIKYAPQPSTSHSVPKKLSITTSITPLSPITSVIHLESGPRTPVLTPLTPVVSPVTPVINIDFTKNLQKPEIQVLNKAVTTFTRESSTLSTQTMMSDRKIPHNYTVKTLSRSSVNDRKDVRTDMVATDLPFRPPNFSLAASNLSLGAGNLAVGTGNPELDEDYDT